MPDDTAQANSAAAPAEGQVAAEPQVAAGGEPQAASAPTEPTAGVEPTLYAGTFQSVEALETGYDEARSAIGRKNDELGQVRQQYNYLASQLGYDPLASEGQAEPAAPAAQPVYAPQPQPVIQAQPPQAPLQRMMEAYLEGTPEGAARGNRIFMQAIHGGAEHVTDNRSRVVERLQTGVHALGVKHGADAVYPLQPRIVGYMQKGLSADEAFFLANRGNEATQQRTTASTEQTVIAGRTAAAGPNAVAQPAAPPVDPGQALKDAMIASAKEEGAFADL